MQLQKNSNMPQKMIKKPKQKKPCCGEMMLVGGVSQPSKESPKKGKR